MVTLNSSSDIPAEDMRLLILDKFQPSGLSLLLKERICSPGNKSVLLKVASNPIRKCQIF